MQKKLGGAFHDLLLNKKQKKTFVFPNNANSEASRSHLLFVLQKAPPSFLHTLLLKNEAQTSEKKSRAVIFYLEERKHTKI